jgi:hypothetical protein
MAQSMKLIAVKRAIAPSALPALGRHHPLQHLSALAAQRGKWVQKTIFDPMGATGSGWISQNKKQQALSFAGVQLRMQDWIRFAWWVKQTSLRTDCLGGFVKDAMHTQIATGRTGARGYGYLTWTDLVDAPNTAWAWGYGGQRIGWNQDGNRILVVFSNLEDWMPDLSKLLMDWKGVDR